MRFSTVVGSKGSADTVRDPRGFSIKFYTGEGNYDLVGNNLPVFFIRDAIKFPDMVHAFKPSPRATFTKTWPEDIFPLTPVGMMVLNKNPENFFAEVEQAAFCPSAIVPGIELSADKLLQGRVFAYADTQRHRLGTNYLQLPINRPLVPVANNQRDGAMQCAPYGGGTVNYEPNSLANGQPGEAPPAPASVTHVEGVMEQRRLELTNDFEQAGERYRSLDKVGQNHLVGNIVDSLGNAQKPIQKRMLKNLASADPGFGKRVASALKR